MDDANDKIDIMFDGELTTVTPLAYSPPDSTGPNKESLLPRITAFENGNPVEVPFVSGAAFRGPLRRACADALREKVGVKPSFITLLEWRVGGAKSSEKEDIDPAERMALIDRHPLLALFGAGSSKAGFVSSKLRTGHLIPPGGTTPVVIKGVRRGEHRDVAVITQLDKTEREKLFKWSDANTARSRLQGEKTTSQRRLNALKRDVADGKRAPSDPDYRAALATFEKLSAELEEAEAVAATLGGDVSILLPLPGYEALPTGIRMKHRFDARGVSMLEAGLLVEGLRRWSMDPRIGARIAHGCGEVAGRYTVKTRPKGTAAWTDDGTLSFDLLSGLTTDSDTLAQAATKWNEATIDYKNTTE